MTAAGESVWDCPASFQAALDALLPVDKMSRFLEDEAVTVINADVIAEAVRQCGVHQMDAGVASALLNGLAKIAGECGA
jgi:hypothetical protein